MEAAVLTECTFRTNKQQSFRRTYQFCQTGLHVLTHLSRRTQLIMVHLKKLTMLHMSECQGDERNVLMYRANPVAARSKAWVCGSSVTRVAGSNPAEGTEGCLL